jgi:hypothetical protein
MAVASVKARRTLEECAALAARSREFEEEIKDELDRGSRG